MDARPCPNCGGTEFVRGQLDAPDAGRTFFKAENRSVGDFLTERKKGDVAARMCRTCGRLDLFVEGYFDA